MSEHSVSSEDPVCSKRPQSVHHGLGSLIGNETVTGGVFVGSLYVVYQLTIRWWKVDMATSSLLKLIQARKNF
jgi:hypothetical protein